MRLPSRLSAVLLAGLSASPLQAEALRCDMKVQPDKWVRASYFIGISPDGKRAIVSDAIVMHYNGAPIAAQIRRNDDRRLRVDWVLKDIRNTASNQYLERMDFSLSYNRVTHRADIILRPFNYSNEFSAGGACVELKDVKLPKF